MTVTAAGAYSIRQAHGLTEEQMQELALVLIDCVEGGAAVTFMHPVPLPKALAFWRRVAADVETGARILLLAENSSGIIGTVQVVLAQPENQPHRAEVSKMLVHRRARRLGIGASLMRAAEEAARNAGKSLLVLDTASDDADRLYVRLGWTLYGSVPDYSLLPHGGLCTARFYYRHLDP